MDKKCIFAFTNSCEKTVFTQDGFYHPQIGTKLLTNKQRENITT